MFNFSPTLKKTLANLTWLSVDRIVRMFGAVVVNALLTRYLGPEQNGVLSYALAFVGIFTPLAVLGMDAIVIRDIVRFPEQKNEILGSAFGLRIAGACSALLIVTGTIFLIRPDDSTTQLLVFITAAGMIFQSFDVIDYWFQSQLLSKYTVYAKNIAFFSLNIIKIFCIFVQSEIYIFVLISSIELIAAAIGLIVMYNNNGNSIRQWNFNFSRAKTLLTNSWPIIITDVAIFTQSRMDQIMLRELLGEREIGLYAAAQKIAEPLAFIPMIIMSSIYPVIVRTREWSVDEYYNRLTNLYRMMFIITIAIGIPISLLSKPIISLLYGDKFAFSATLLSLLIWVRFYSNIGVVRSIFTSTENLFRHTMMCAVGGSVVNIACNYFLIPQYGVYGSIIATHAGFIVTIFVFDGFAARTKKNFQAMVNGIFTFYKFRLGS